MTDRETAMLNLLEDIEEAFSMQNEKFKKSLMRDAITIISKLILSPPKPDKPKFDIPEGLK